ncbi:hypothetical protein [Dyadobacter sp. CY323]|uniref:hypothetical protein n=1 Tax=Dyadobacter sp. CY323 TaxID=2907302 RepID=UPI001F3E79A1|nr:hypothetical protein [Dyadobacter sp. CY323]MCE6987809.1 hypothetical protein [Dyadobacter sp. CY323]
MNRAHFLKLSLLVPFSANLLGERRLLRADRLKKGFNVGNGKDRFDKSISLLEGDTFYTKISSKDTNGDLYAFGEKALAA